MQLRSNPQILTFLRFFVKAVALIVLSVGLAGFIGWIFDIPLFRSILPNASPLRFNSTIGLMCAGLALWVLHDSKHTLRRKRIGQALAVVVLLIGALTLSEALFHWDSGIDQFIFDHLPASSTEFPGRMAPVTAFCFVLIGIVFLIIGSEVSQYLAIGVAVLSLLAVIGYIFDYQSLYQLAGYGSISLHSALAFLVLSLAVIVAAPMKGIGKIVVSNLSGGGIIRYLLPGTILLVILLGLFIEQGKRLELFDEKNEVVILVLLLTLVYSPFIYRYAVRINQVEEDVIRLNRLYATLSQINQMIVRVKDKTDLYQSICDIAVRYGEFSMAWIGLLDEVSGDITPIAANDLDVKRWPFPIVNIRQGDLQNSLVATAIRTRHVVTSDDIQTDQRTQVLHTQVESFDYRSTAAVPFMLDGKPVGAVVLVSSDVGFFRAGMESHLLEEMGVDISFALASMETEARRKEAEESLRESEERFSKAFYQSPIGIVLIDLTDFTIRDINDSLLDITGLSREEVINKSSLLINLQVDAEERVEIVQELQEHGRYQNKEMRLGLESGEIRYVLNSGTLVMIRGKPHNLALIQDITERKEAEKELQFYASIVESAADAIIGKTLDGIILSWNPGAEKLYGYPASDVIGKPIAIIVPPDRPDEITAILDMIKNGQRVEHYETVRLTKAGQRIAISLTVSPILDAEGQIVAASSIGHDISERKQAEEKIAYQAHLLENVNDAVLATDTQFNITSWNRAAEELYGYKADEVLGRKVQEFIRSDFSNEQRIRAVKALREGGSYRTEVLQYHRDGNSFWVDGSTFALRATSGHVYGYVSINRDITQRKHAEQQVQRQLKQLNALRVIDNAISASFDLHLILEILLEQVLSHLSVDASAVLLFDPELQIFEYAASRGFRSNALHHTKLKLGEGYASQAVLEGRTIQISALMETGGKLAKALQAANEEFIDYYGAPLIVKGTVKGVLEIYHRSKLIVDSEWLEFLETLAGQAAIAINDAQLVESLQSSNVQLEQRVAERTAELNQMNFELEHANRAKDEFLATMSHELRTPLTSILGLSESLLEQRRSPLDEYQQKSLEIIESSGEHLLQLINDILDLSKIDAGKFDFYAQPVPVDELCKSSLSFIKSQALKKSISVIYANETNVSKIYADTRRLKQILVNLLSNAVKFTEENGQVILQVNADTDQDLIQFSVIDNGIGIAPEDLQKLFQPFVQLDSRLNRQHQGTGLGLALVQRLTDLHGGSVQVESVVGKGSRFTINLAIRQDEIARLDEIEHHTIVPSVDRKGEQNELPIEASAKRGVVLLAEDNMANILTIGEYLESHGYQVVVAHDGLEAVEMAEATQPDIILMDIQMPVLDGLDAIARLRQNPVLATTPIIALTALAMPGDRERCLVAGASEYMSKPVSLKTLVQTIQNLLQNGFGNALT